MHNKQTLAPAIRKLGLALTAAALLMPAFSGIAQAQYGYAPYGYYGGDLTRYNVPAEQHQWYDRGNTDFNS